MAVSFVAAGAAQSSGVTTPAATLPLTPALPTGSASGDRIFVYEAIATTTTAASPTNWTALYKDLVIGSGAAGSGTGQRLISCHWRDYDGVWTMPAFDTVSSTQATHVLASIGVRKGSTETFGTPTASAKGDFYGTPGTAFTITTGSAFATVAGALLVAHACTNDAPTMSAEAITGTNGFVSGTVTERIDAGNATGNQVRLFLSTCIPTAAGSPAGTLTHTATMQSATEGGAVIVQQALAVPSAFAFFAMF